jgi:hypothetical protein
LPADLATADRSKSRSYLSALGQLLFAASTLRYDLAFVVSLVGYCDGAWADDQPTSRSTGSWLFMLGIRVQRPVPLYVDNEGAIKPAHNPRWHSRTRQIRIRYHQIRRSVAEGAVKPTYISTTDQLADLGTKALCCRGCSERPAGCGCPRRPVSRTRLWVRGASERVLNRGRLPAISSLVDAVLSVRS